MSGIPATTTYQVTKYRPILSSAEYLGCFFSAHSCMPGAADCMDTAARPTWGSYCHMLSTSFAAYNAASNEGQSEFKEVVLWFIDWVTWSRFVYIIREGHLPARLYAYVRFANSLQFNSIYKRPYPSYQDDQQ